jgi:hypothetical protein
VKGAVLLRSRWLATTLVVAQLFAVAHLALVPHTAGVSGAVASSVTDLEQHLDAVSHPGPHAHAPPKHALRSGEEHCAVLGMLRAAMGHQHTPPSGISVVHVDAPRELLSALVAATRRERLLAAPKASPPFVA